MDTHQIIIKPIEEVAKYKRTLIPAHISEMYALKPMYENITSADTIRNGVIAFRDFLYLFFDRLIEKGQLYAKPPRKPTGMDDYPFLHYITNILVEIGYNGKLSENEDILVVTKIPICMATIDENGKKKGAKIPAYGLVESLRFLELCGFNFVDINLDVKLLDISEAQPLKVSYPNNSILLVGLKALAIADIERRKGRAYWNDHYLLRCNYKMLKVKETDIIDELRDFLDPLSEKVQSFALKLHQRYTKKGLTCTLSILDDTSFSYANISDRNKNLSARKKYQKRIWAFSNSIRNGYNLFVKSTKTEKYADVIERFPPSLRKKIEDGYGCYRKLGRERCQADCQGIRLPLDESILDIADDIEIWIDNEIPHILK